jgi:nitrogen fixation-related uncharacterized protein
MKKRDSIILSTAILIATAASFYMIWKKKKEQYEDTPPKDAPQLNIGNPGDQSEFPSAPEEERGLG